MDRQNALLPEIEETPNQPELRGFHYQEEIVTKEEEAALVTSLGQLDLNRDWRAALKVAVRTGLGQQSGATCSR
jgi:hypothetical protein